MNLWVKGGAKNFCSVFCITKEERFVVADRCNQVKGFASAAVKFAPSVCIVACIFRKRCFCSESMHTILLTLGSQFCFVSISGVFCVGNTKMFSDCILVNGLLL